MKNYAKTELFSFFRITSIISLFQSGKVSSGAETTGEAHPFWEFVHVEKGDINILVDGEVYSLHAGCLIIYEPHSFHSVVTSRDAIINVVCFETDSSVMSGFSGNIIEINELHHQKLSDIIALGKSIFIPAPREKYDGGMLMRKDTDAATLQRLSNNLELFILDLYEYDKLIADNSHSSVYRFENRTNHRFWSLMQYMKKNISKNITIEELCNVCSTSVSGLHRLCKNECGTSPIELFISLKIGEAKRLITQRHMNFSEISEALGFSSVHYFSKLFKKKTGMTPSKYLKSIEK